MWQSKSYRKIKTSHEVHFSRIWDYQANILHTKPYSTMEIEMIPEPVLQSKQRFDRLYMCFAGLKHVGQ